MKNIAVIEIYSHHVFVHTLAASLLASGHKVTVYVSSRIFKDLEPMFLVNEAKPKFILSGTNESDFSFLKRIKPEIDREYDLLFINSIQGYRVGYFYLFKFNLPTIAAAGRISEFFGSSYKIRGLKTIRQVLHHNYTKFFLPKVLKRLEGLIVHTEKARSLAISSGYSNPIHCMPFSLHIPNAIVRQAVAKKVNFLITGSITARSRDYFAVLNVFKRIWEDGLVNAELTVLSSPRTDYGFEVYAEMQRLAVIGYPITYFSGWIPEEDFVAHSSKADFLIAPILKEYYGAGEITSVEVESVRMGIPAFYPDWYYVDQTRQESCIFYASYAHLQEMVKGLVFDNSQVTQARERALKNAETLTVDQVSEKLNIFLKQDHFTNLNSGD